VSPSLVWFHCNASAGQFAPFYCGIILDFPGTSQPESDDRTSPSSRCCTHHRSRIHSIKHVIIECCHDFTVRKWSCEWATIQECCEDLSTFRQGLRNRFRVARKVWCVRSTSLTLFSTSEICARRQYWAPPGILATQ
jgi:hypothetical protein